MRPCLGKENTIYKASVLILVNTLSIFTVKCLPSLSVNIVSVNVNLKNNESA